MERYNYHTHTYRCQHADGTDREYVLEAIRNGYERIGFSDHVMLPGITSQYHIRGDFSLTENYFQSIRALQKEFQNEIKISLGFECEWDRRFIAYYRSLLEDKKVDFLIFGNHGISFTKNGEHILQTKNKYAFLNIYLQKSICAIKSGLFRIFAHPDIFMSVTSWGKKTEDISYVICHLAKQYDVALELNLGKVITTGIAEYYGEMRYPYPYNLFWKIAKEVGNTIIVGLDAHSPSAFGDKRLRFYDEFVAQLGLTVEHDFTI